MDDTYRITHAPEEVSADTLEDKDVGLIVALRFAGVENGEPYQLAICIEEKAWEALKKEVESKLNIGATASKIKPTLQ